MTSQNPTAAIPKGSLIIVTGVTSYVASYAIKDLLERGYHIRGVVRDLAKAAWLTEEVFPAYAQSGVFTLVEVPDQTAPGAFDDVILKSNASAVLHTASPLSLSPDPNEVIPVAVDAILNLLRTAQRETSIERFVYTSSISAAFSPAGSGVNRLGQDSWNDFAVELAWSPPPYEPTRGLHVYAASKAAAERALFKFVAEEKPRFAVNTVLPFTTIGPVLNKRYRTHTTAAMVESISKGEPGYFALMPSLRHINVQDIGAIHVAALLDPDVRGERLYAFGDPLDGNITLAILRRLHPDRQFMDDLPPVEGYEATLDNEERVFGLLKKWAGRDRWISLEDSVRQSLDS